MKLLAKKTLLIFISMLFIWYRECSILTIKEDWSMQQIRDELKKLINETDILQLSFIDSLLDKSSLPEDVKKVIEEKKSTLYGIFFVEKYQEWYTKSRQLIKLFLNDRLVEFDNLYLPDSKRKEVNILNYTIFDAFRGIRSAGGRYSPITAFEKLKNQVYILKSLGSLLESKLDDVKGLIEFNFYNKEIDAAQHLCDKGYLRSSGALCGVIIEEHLISLLNKSNIPITKEHCIHDYGQLLHSNDLIDLTKFKYLIYLSDIRNKCDHKKNEEPTKDEISKLISGTKEVLSTY